MDFKEIVESITSEDIASVKEFFNEGIVDRKLELFDISGDEVIALLTSTVRDPGYSFNLNSNELHLGMFLGILLVKRKVKELSST